MSELDDLRGAGRDLLALLEGTEVYRDERIGHAADRLDQVVNRDRVSRVVTPEAQEALAVALEEAAQRVRQSTPAGFEVDVEDDVDTIVVGPGQTIPGMRSPLRRVFRVEW